MSHAPRLRIAATIVLVVAGSLPSASAPPAVVGAEALPVTRQDGVESPAPISAAALPIELPGGGWAALGGNDGILADGAASRQVTSTVEAPSKATELTDLRTEHSRTIANPDGSYSLEATVGRMHFQDQAGAWQPLDLRLAPTKEGTLKVVSSDRQIEIAAADPDAGLASVQTDQGMLRIRALEPGLARSGVPGEKESNATATPEPAPTTSPSPSSPSEIASPAPVGSPEPSPSPAPVPPDELASAPPPSVTPSQSLTPSTEPTPSSSPAPSASPETAPATPAETLVPATDEQPVERVAFALEDGPEQLVLRATDDGFAFEMHLRDPSAKTRFDYAIATDGLDVVLDGQRVLLVRPGTDRAEKGVVVGTISAPFLFDAADAVAPPEAVTVTIARPGDVAPEGVAQSSLDGLTDEVLLSYAIDSAWLSAPERTFPVTLDPLACMGVGVNVASCAQYDTSANNFDFWIASSSNPANNWTVTRVGRDVRTDDGAVFGTERAMFYFADVVLPDGAQVTESLLKLRLSALYGAADTQELRPFLMTKAWSTSSIWSSLGSSYYDTNVVGPDFNIPSAAGDVEIDVTKLSQRGYTRRAKDWRTNVGILLKMVNEGAAYGEVSFRRYTDATAAYRPKLVMTYVTPRVDIDFDPALGPDYSPSSMIAGSSTVLPVLLRNDGSGFTYDVCTSTSDADCYEVGYRWINHEGDVVGSNQENLPANITTGTQSAIIGLDIMPPTVPGQYTLGLDLIHRIGGDTGTRLYASDWAAPSKYYSRDKKLLTASNTRWVGTSGIERAEFGISVTAGVEAVNRQAVTLGDGSSLAIDIATHNLHYEGAGGVGFGDLVPVGLSFGYDSAAAGSCTGYLGLIGACGWYTNWDERLVDASADGNPGDYIYQGPSGTPYFVSTDAQGQMTGSAPVLLERPTATIVDENGGPANSLVVASTAAAVAWRAMVEEAGVGRYVQVVVVP